MTTSSKSSHGTSTTATHAPAATSSKTDKYATNPSGVVVGLTLGMAWQLAIVVLVPLFGGHLLDDRFKTSPTLTLIGLALAMLFMVLVVRRTLSQLNEYVGKQLPDTRKEAHK